MIRDILLIYDIDKIDSDIKKQINYNFHNNKYI